MASHHPIRKHVAPESPVIPDKLYFRIGDVARLCNVPAYVLRFWETEFPQLKPNKGGTGQRLYRKRDVEMALRIKSLLYDQGYTIAGARQVFKTEATAKESPESSPAPAASFDSQPASDRAAEAAASIDIGAAIRQDAQHRDHLASLRDELRSLATLLSEHESSPASHAAASATTPEIASRGGKLKPMRPRLVLEPKLEPRPETKPESRSEPRPIDQGDLFPSE